MLYYANLQEEQRKTLYVDISFRDHRVGIGNFLEVEPLDTGLQPLGRC